MKTKKAPDNSYLSIPEVARSLSMSRVAVYKKVKRGEIRAIKIGRTYGIPRSYLAETKGTTSANKKKQIRSAVQRVVKDYGELLRKLGDE